MVNKKIHTSGSDIKINCSKFKNYVSYICIKISAPPRNKFSPTNIINTVLFHHLNQTSRSLSVYELINELSNQLNCHKTPIYNDQ